MPDRTDAHGPAFQCVACHSPLARFDDEPVGGDGDWSCPRGHRYSSLAGIVDCRGPLIGYDTADDRRQAESLIALGDVPFETLLRHYWAGQGAKPELVERFVSGDLIGAARAAQVADQIEGGLGPLEEGSVALEVGCGTAALGAELARRATWVVASDISLAWLVLAGHRLRAEQLTNVTLVAATADLVPFPEETFDLVAAADVIEHVPDVPAMVRGCYRVLKTSGSLWLSTPNRYSLTPEPHVRVWGVGWLPRPLGIALVRRVRGVAYDDIRTLSSRSLRRLLGASGGSVTVYPPPIAQAVRDTYRPAARRLIDVYGLLLGLPIARQMLLGVAPLFHARLRKVATPDGLRGDSAVPPTLPLPP